MKSMLLHSVTGRILFVLVFLLVFINPLYAQSNSENIKVLYVESFESGMNGWSAQNGLWEAGVPTSGPSSVGHGEQVAATILDGDYPLVTQSRLVSPRLRLPVASNTSSLRLNVSHWYSLSSGDLGDLQISVDEGPWESLLVNPVAGISTGWEELVLPQLDTFAGMDIRIGFMFTAEDESSSSGWYIDRIQIVAVENTLERSESFEGNVIGWVTDGTQWEFGAPTSGPASAFEGEAVAGTVLGGTYTDGDASRLISPPIQVPDLNTNEQFKLRFWHWFNFGKDDTGSLSISVDGGNFEPIESTFKGESRVWTKYIVPDLLADDVAGAEVRIAFDLNTIPNGSNRAGWYIDMIETTLINQDSVTKSTVSAGKAMEDLPFEGTLDGAEWYADNGVWEIGEASPESGFHQTGSGLIAGTVLEGTYPNETVSRLISPPITITTSSFSIELTHSFSLSENDSAFIQIDIGDGVWKTIGEPFTGTSGTDTEFRIDSVVTISPESMLGDLQGKDVRLGFLLVSQEDGSTSTGWYIANIGVGEPTPIIKVANEELELPNTTVLHPNYPNPFNPTTTLSFELADSGPVTLTIYDVLGREIETLVDGALGAGPHAFTWSAQDASSGIYLYRLTTPSQTLTRQMILFR